MKIQHWNQIWGSGVWASVKRPEKTNTPLKEISGTFLRKNPTAEQSLTCLHLCQSLSNLYRDIHLFRFDEQTREVYILAGDSLEIIVNFEGNWQFISEVD